MREEYDIKALNPRKNPYGGKVKQQVTININTTTIEYFKEMSSQTGVPYQVLINLYLDECVKEKKTIQFV
ncbi:MAG: antitoxin [Lachnospiraceae bacterium]|nr:antitoxin [Lachnospiraceae bacterium]